MNIVTDIIYINEKQQNNKPIQTGIEFPTLTTDRDHSVTKTAAGDLPVFLSSGCLLSASAPDRLHDETMRWRQGEVPEPGCPAARSGPRTSTTLRAADGANPALDVAAQESRMSSRRSRTSTATSSPPGPTDPGLIALLTEIQTSNQAMIQRLDALEGQTTQQGPQEAVNAAVDQVLQSITGGKVQSTASTCRHQAISIPRAAPSVDLTRDAQALLSQALGQNTQAVYRRTWMLYGEYALSQNIPVAIPVTEQSLFLFIVYMKKQQYAAATITSYVSATGYIHKLASSFLVKKSLQAIRKMQPSCITRLPIKEDILHLLVTTAGHAIHSMYCLKLMQAMFMLAYHAFLRVGEITESEHNLFLSDVTLTTTTIKLLFRSSKHASGISQEAMVSAMTGEMYCPVYALSEYMSYRGKNPGPLFLWRGSHFLVKNLYQV